MEFTTQGQAEVALELVDTALEVQGLPPAEDVRSLLTTFVISASSLFCHRLWLTVVVLVALQRGLAGSQGPVPSGRYVLSRTNATPIPRKHIICIDEFNL